MTIDASIPGRITPSNVKSPQDVYSQAMRRRSDQQDMALREMQMRKLREDETYRSSQGRQQQLEDQQRAATVAVQRALWELQVDQHKEVVRLAKEAGKLQQACLNAAPEDAEQCYREAVISGESQRFLTPEQAAEALRIGFTDEVKQKTKDAYEQTDHFRKIADEELKQRLEVERDKKAAAVELKKVVAAEERAAERARALAELKHGQKISDEIRAQAQGPDDVMSEERLQQMKDIARAGRGPTPKQIADAEAKLNRTRREITARFKKLQNEALERHGGFARGSLKMEPTGEKMNQYAAKLDHLAAQRAAEYAQAEEVYTATTQQRSKTAGSNAPGLGTGIEGPTNRPERQPPPQRQRYNPQTGAIENY